MNTANIAGAAIVGIVSGLVIAAMALTGVVLTIRATGRRERDERVWVDRNWVRDQRREAHTRFLKEQRRLDSWMMMYTRVGLAGTAEPGEDWTAELSSALVDVQLFGSAESATAASMLFRATRELENGTLGAMAQVDTYLAKYRKSVQVDLGYEPTDLPSYDEIVDTMEQRTEQDGI